MKYLLTDSFAADVRPFQTVDFSYFVAVFSFCGLGGDWVGDNRRFRNLLSFGMPDGVLNDDVRLMPDVKRLTETRMDASGIGMVVRFDVRWVVGCFVAASDS